MFLDDGTETSKEFTAIYSWWACALVLQLFWFTWHTGLIRVRTETIHSDEDRMWMNDPTLCTTGGGHPEVDHIRGGHLSDLSLIMPYLMITLIWLNTSPSSLIASFILRIFPIAKICHSIFYMKLVEPPKNWETISLGICYVILVYMSVSIAYVFYA